MGFGQLDIGTFGARLKVNRPYLMIEPTAKSGHIVGVFFRARSSVVRAGDS
jgi:hypothetical protein